jgi:hypothetical protein
MSLHDVSNDPSLIGWLRQAGHGHLLSDHQNHYANVGLHQSHYANVGLSSPSPPIISGGHSSVDPYIDSYNRSASYSGVDPYTNSYNRSASYSGVANFNTLSHNHQQSPTNFVSTPTQFFAPHMNQHQLDMDIEVKKSNFIILFFFTFINK